MNSIQEIIDDVREGKMVILVDDENRENEGDLILAADFVTPHAINFMALEARGLICLSLTTDQIRQLNLPQMVKDDINYSPNKTAFTLSIEAAAGVSTGISAADRAHTIRVAANPNAKPADLIVPGHVFPIRAQVGGVLKRAGHTEASVDLARLAGLNPAAVICEVMNLDGTMARTEQLKEFSEKHGIKIGSIEDLIKYRLENESFVEERTVSRTITEMGSHFRIRRFRNTIDGREHLALTLGELNSPEPVLVRVQNENVLEDVFGQLQNNSSNVRSALSLIEKHGRGVLVYLRQEDFEGANSDQRDYGVGAQILHALGLKKIILLTNNPSKRIGLKGFGLEVVDTLALSDHNYGSTHVHGGLDV
jgi:3,4-dihydroxy 2-butanone 4-phosphate synthase / GTP cyclohydrolase II